MPQMSPLHCAAGDPGTTGTSGQAQQTVGVVVGVTVTVTGAAGTGADFGLKMSTRPIPTVIMPMTANAASDAQCHLACFAALQVPYQLDLRQAALQLQLL